MGIVSVAVLNVVKKSLKFNPESNKEASDVIREL